MKTLSTAVRSGGRKAKPDLKCPPGPGAHPHADSVRSPELRRIVGPQPSARRRSGLRSRPGRQVRPRAGKNLLPQGKAHSSSPSGRPGNRSPCDAATYSKPTASPPRMTPNGSKRGIAWSDPRQDGFQRDVGLARTTLTLNVVLSMPHLRTPRCVEGPQQAEWSFGKKYRRSAYFAAFLSIMPATGNRQVPS